MQLACLLKQGFDVSRSLLFRWAPLFGGWGIVCIAVLLTRTRLGLRGFDLCFKWRRLVLIHFVVPPIPDQEKEFALGDVP